MGNSRSPNFGSLSNPACSRVFGSIVTSFPSLSTVTQLPGKELGVVNTRKVSCQWRCSFSRWSLALRAIIVKNSGNSIFPLPSSSNSLIIVWKRNILLIELYEICFDRELCSTWRYREQARQLINALNQANNVSLPSPRKIAHWYEFYSGSKKRVSWKLLRVKTKWYPLGQKFLNLDHFTNCWLRLIFFVLIGN